MVVCVGGVCGLTVTVVAEQGAGASSQVTVSAVSARRSSSQLLKVALAALGASRLTARLAAWQAGEPVCTGKARGHGEREQ